MIAESGQFHHKRGTSRQRVFGSFRQQEDRLLMREPEGTASGSSTNRINVTINGDLLSEIASNVQDAPTLASLSLVDKVSHDAAAPSLTQKENEDEAAKKAAKAWVDEMIAKHGGMPSPEPGWPSHCPACGCRDSWRLTFNWSQRPSADVQNQAQCSNPACREKWWADC